MYVQEVCLLRMPLEARLQALVDVGVMSRYNASFNSATSLIKLQLLETPRRS